MVLNQSLLRGILARILSVDQSYIVPKQGNWYNPQDRDQLSTFIAYVLRSSDSIVMPYYFNGALNPTSVALKKGVLELQFVGNSAEELADSVSHWIHRKDVQAEFKAVNAQLMATDFGNYQVSNFSQAGLNTVLAFNVSCPLQWISTIEANQDRIESATMTGGLT